MSALDDFVLQRLRSRFGDEIDLTSDSPVVSAILAEIGSFAGGLPPLAGYDKTYTEGYNKIDYSRGDYHRYDRTVDIADDRIRRMQPAINKLIIDRMKEHTKPS